MKRLDLLVVAACVGVLVAIPARAQTKEVIEWRIHSPNEEGRIEYIMQKEWAETLTKESGGRLKVTLYPSGSLGFKDADMLRVVSQNIIEGYHAWVGYTVRDDAILALTSLDMMLNNRQTFINYIPYAFELAKKRLSSKWKIRYSIANPSPACTVGIVGKAPYNSIESLRGKKVRSWGKETSETLNRLDIPAQTMAQADLYLALKTGVLDGAIFLPNGYLASSLYEVAPYWSSVSQLSALQGMFTSEAAFNALPPDLKAMMERVEINLRKKWMNEAMDWCARYEDPSFVQLKQKGAKILAPFSQKDQETLAAVEKQVWRDRAKEIGPEAVEVQKTLEGYLSRAESGK